MIGFLGGTFDPIHNGHLHAATSAAAALDLERVNLVLAARPKHRAQPFASIEHRWAMLELAVAGNERLRADDREIRRGTATYTVETLEEVRVRYGAEMPLVWLLGWDAYRGLPTWHRWRELARLAHLAVLQRPGDDAQLDYDHARIHRGAPRERRCVVAARARWSRRIRRGTDAERFIDRDPNAPTA